MNIETIIKPEVRRALKELYQADVNEDNLQLQKTRREFKGDITIVVFPLVKYSKRPPEQTAEELGTFLLEALEDVSEFNVIKGFLNLVISPQFWLQYIREIGKTGRLFEEDYQLDQKEVMIEYSSPNTNKPLHLGHIRNNLIGYSLSKIIEASGRKVIKVNLVNDRGIHICKSMLAWQKWGNGETPESSGKKGDHLVGDYYVKFDQEFKKQISSLVAEGMSTDEASRKAPLILEAQEMLRKWEAGDPVTVDLWETMNGWVYKGFDETYNRLGVSFDKIYYESQTYKQGKSIVLKGLEDGVLYRREDNSVWANLNDEGLDEKLLLRSDGTSVYMTQDIGTAAQRFNEYDIDEIIYVVGNEQNYHFQVLSIVMDKLGFPWAENLHHLSYGMVELPEGKMKSREGTVVDADDLIDEMISTARDMSDELGKLDGYSYEEKEQIYRIIGLGA
ncbi:MAG TPA: arginine--tRNA ligase, partial [Bacteroidales bacterium]|nr:arginine--tRNA ligase [Bacteroidales bacterium]